MNVRKQASGFIVVAPIIIAKILSYSSTTISIMVTAVLFVWENGWLHLRSLFLTMNGLSWAPSKKESWEFVSLGFATDPISTYVPIILMFLLSLCHMGTVPMGIWAAHQCPINFI